MPASSRSPTRVNERGEIIAGPAAFVFEAYNPSCLILCAPTHPISTPPQSVPNLSLPCADEASLRQGSRPECLPHPSPVYSRSRPSAHPPACRPAGRVHAVACAARLPAQLRLHAGAGPLFTRPASRRRRAGGAAHAAGGEGRQVGGRARLLPLRCAPAPPIASTLSWNWNGESGAAVQARR